MIHTMNIDVRHCTVISLQELYLKLVAGREIFTSIVVCMGSVAIAAPMNEIYRHEPNSRIFLGRTESSIFDALNLSTEVMIAQCRHQQ